MRKLTLFLSVFLLSLLYAKAQECGTIDFPRFIPDSVCTSDTLLIATQAELGDNQIYGAGILEWNNDFYLNPNSEDVGYRIYVKIAGLDTCNQLAQDSVSVFVNDCEGCNPNININPFTTIPDSICRNAGSLRIVNTDLSTDDLFVDGDGIRKEFATNQYTYYYDFYPDSVMGSLATFTVIDSNYCDTSKTYHVVIKDCPAPCETVSFVNSLPDEICSDSSNSIYLTSTTLYDAPIHVFGKGIYAEAQNGGLDSAYYFDPSLVDSVDYNEPFLILIQAYDVCQSQAYDSLVVYDCGVNDCITFEEFVNPIPDTICSTADPILIANGSDFELFISDNDYIEEIGGNYYFNPAFAVSDTFMTVGVKVFNFCQDSFYVEQYVYVENCPAPCETVSFVNSLPDEICSDSSNSIYLTSTTLYDAPIHVFGKGIYAEAQNGGLDSAYYFDPSLVDSVDYNEPFLILIQAYDVCQSQAYDSLVVYDCGVNDCITFEEFANPIPDTICSTADPILIAYGDDFELIIPNNKAIEIINGDYYFNPSLTAVDSAISFGLTVHNVCQDSFYVEQQYVYIENCEPDCGTPQFTNTLPEEVCNNDPRIYLTSTQEYDYSIKVAGNGVVAEVINNGADTAYYLDPSTVSGVLPQYPLIIIRAEDDCRNYVLDSTEVKTCIDSCTIVPDFPYPLPDSICFSTGPIIFEFLNTLDIWGDGIVYDGEIGFDPSVPAMNHYAVIYASVENVCNEDVVVSDTVFISACTVNALNDFTGENIDIYPNPVSDQLTISGEGIKLVQVKDITGKTVLIQENTKLDVSGLANGIYFVQIELHNGVIKTEKVVKK